MFELGTKKSNRNTGQAGPQPWIKSLSFDLRKPMPEAQEQHISWCRKSSQFVYSYELLSFVMLHNILHRLNVRLYYHVHTVYLRWDAVHVWTLPSLHYKIPEICNTNVGGKLHDATGNQSNKVQRGNDGLQLRVLLQIQNKLSALSKASIPELITNKALIGSQQISMWKSVESFKIYWPCFKGLSAPWITTQDRWISIRGCEALTNTELWSRLPHPPFSYEDWCLFWAGVGTSCSDLPI